MGESYRRHVELLAMVLATQSKECLLWPVICATFVFIEGLSTCGRWINVLHGSLNELDLSDSI